ncbi:related to Ribosomal RNA-processing protein 1 [Saccharomycodes ludwigii]|uniref:Related to Ribosomal RNA-processing protein 1 n=1 Tax=Saccharomycodes ludwigii TaxID=36035 RepID=A0A376B5R1_9ASCO|nr:hypothetical protein SCDLUD_001652 [Saccharomycodes ludwigii]KAH3901868.1 hypothetical protein SCDLUD_001652 [Saccharomycodes ludwigii]SSD59804.1 related to Ribosomal RNA-processing protein 1 [Saccharomycodes ludwigii]
MSIENSSLVKKLASNNKPTRDKALESLQKYLQLSHLKQKDYDKIWKGLYYSMWFCDKPRPQQRLADKLGELHLIFLSQNNKPNVEGFIRFSKSFWKVILLEWYTIDHHRIDKYLLLIRRCFYNQLLFLDKCSYDSELVSKYLEKVLMKFPLSGDKRVYTGIPMHIIDIFVDEWERVFEKEEEESDDEENEKRKQIDQKIINASCVSKMVDIFQKLYDNVLNSKVLRKKIKEDILENETLLEWNVINQHLQKTETTTEQDENEEEEWNGF